MDLQTPHHPLRRLRAGLSLILIIASGLCLSGCATLEDESDMPWAAPEPWEGAPSIPGFNQY
ncbi:MAG: hypothetical protein HQ523_01120 [Lentisphaerae bacterium]|nr:hypothetical protein [Lentisphaerota bacterium]